MGKVVATVAGAAGQAFGFTPIGIALTGISLLASASAKSKSSVDSSTSSNNEFAYIDSGINTNTRNTVEYMQLVYGTVRKSGLVAFERLTSSGKNNLGETKTGRSSYLNQIIVYAGHESDGVEGMYLDDELLNINSEGWVTNAKYTKNTDDQEPVAATNFGAAALDTETATGSVNSASIIIAYDYTQAQTYLEQGDLIQISGFSDSAYNGQFEIDSIASFDSGNATQVNYTTDVEITDPAPSQVGVELVVNAAGYRGNVVYIYNSAEHGLSVGDDVYISSTESSDLEADKAEITEVKSVNTYTYEVDDIPSSTSGSAIYQRRNGKDEYLIYIKTFLGEDGQNIGLDEDVNSKMPNQLKATDKFTNLTCAYARFYDSSEFSTAPQLSMKLRGKKVYDPRDAVTKFSNNAALCKLDYLTDRVGVNNTPIGVGAHIDKVANESDDIDLDVLIDTANASDESIEKLDGSFAPRYTIDGFTNLGEQQFDVLSLMLTSSAGYLTWVDWKLKLHAGVFDLPVHHIDESWLADGFSIEINGDRNSLINTATAVFNDEDNNYYAGDMPKYQDADALADDSDEELAGDFQFPFVKDTEKAQRLAKIFVQRSRKNKTIPLSLTSRGANIAPNDMVAFSYKRLGWVNKTFRAMEVTESAQGQVQVSLKEETASVYEWEASEATI